jgi:ACR3 family arsenite efflux pump ArsB
MTFLRILCLNAPLTVLSWLGRQGTRAVAALVVIGIALPSIGVILKPYVTEPVFVLLCIAFVRVDIAAVKTYLRRPALVLTATVWTSAAIPFLFGLGCRTFGLPQKAPELFLGLMLQAVASPMMAAPALAALMGLDATLVLITLVTSTAIVPITAPMITIAIAALSFAVFIAVLFMTVLMFLSAGRERALALGFMASQRNMGLMLAATGRALPDLTWLYFALSQFPIYLSSHLLEPLARRILARAPIATEPTPGRNT